MDPMPDMKRMLLDTTSAIIEKSGERSVRLRQVAELSGVAEPSLYHYFANREELIIAAQAHRLRENLRVTIEPFLKGMETCQSQKEFLALLHGVFLFAYQPERASIRTARIEIIGNASHRVDLQEQIKEAIDNTLADSIEALELAKKQGWLRHNIDSRSFAMFLLSLISSLVFPELFGDTPMLDNWKAFAAEAVSAIVLDKSQ